VRHAAISRVATGIGAVGWVGGVIGGVIGGRAIESLSQALERGEILTATLVTVDCEHHSRTAVAGLTTVSPDGRGVIDGKGPSGEIGGVGSDWEETGVESNPLASGLVGQGQARGRE